MSFKTRILFVFGIMLGVVAMLSIMIYINIFNSPAMQPSISIFSRFISPTDSNIVNICNDIKLINNNSHPIYFESVEEMKDCWFEILIKQFTTNINSIIYPSNTSTYEYKTQCSHAISTINSDEINLNFQHLLCKTYDKISFAVTEFENLSFRDLLFIKRCILISSLIYNEQQMENSPSSSAISSLISNIAHILQTKLQYIQNSEHHSLYPYFLIHICRSAGSYICDMFIKHKLNVYQGRNCNAPGNDNFFYSPDIEFQECEYQYLLTSKKNMTLIARESPLHFNLEYNGEKSRPLLCSKFRYILNVRSPIERILSFFSCFVAKKKSSDGQIIDDNLVDEQNISIAEDLQFRDYFHHLLFVENKKRLMNVRKKLKALQKERFERKRKIFTFASVNNLLMRWIGYLYDSRGESGVDGPSPVLDAIRANFDYVKEREMIMFVNSMRIMLETDHIFNTAVFDNDWSLMHIFKVYEDKRGYEILKNKYVQLLFLFNDYHHRLKINKIEILDMDMNEVKNGIELKNDEREKGRTCLSSVKVAQSLTDDDWYALFEANWADIKLYSFAKWIEKADEI